MCVMGILKLLMGIIGTGMVLTGSTGGSEQQEDKEDTDSQSGKDQDNSNSDVANASGDNTSTQSSQCVGNPESNIEVNDIRRIHSMFRGLACRQRVNNMEFQNFRTRHAIYCYDMLESAFNWQDNYAYVTHGFHDFLNCIAGDDQEVKGLCFLVLKASVLFQYCMVHCRHESGRLIIFDERSIRDPALLNNLLSKALSILSNTGDINKRMYFSYLALFHMSYSQHFIDMKQIISPQFYRDIQGLLCRIFEYKITNGFDQYIKFTNELLIGCAFFLGGMYNQIHIREATTEATTHRGSVNVLYRSTDVFRRRIGSHRRNIIAWQDLGYRCYRLFTSMLYLYADDTRLFRRGVQSIPQKLLRQCSEDIVELIDTHYLHDEMPYSVIAGNIAGSLSRLINRNNISAIQEDIGLYEQYCIRQCSMNVETSTALESQDIEQLNVSMSVMGINEGQEESAVQQLSSSSSGEGAVGEVAGSRDNQTDYTRLGARPKVRSRRSSDKTLKQDESHTSVEISQVSTGTSSTFVDKKSGKLVGIIKSSDSSSSQEIEQSMMKVRLAGNVMTTDKLSDIGLHGNVIQPVHISEVEDNLPQQSYVYRQGTCVGMPRDHIRKFRRLHVTYLYNICPRVIVSMHGEIRATAECVQVMLDIFKNDRSEQGLFLLMLKISMLLQFCGAHFCREQIRYMMFDARPWSRECKDVDYVLYEILGVINTSSSLSNTIMLISGILRQKYNVDRRMLTKMPHTPNFYRKVMNLLCKVCQYKRECSNFGQNNVHSIVISQVIICCAILMGSMYCRMESMGIRDPLRSLDVECYHVLIAFMYLYEVRAQAKVDYVSHDPLVIPQGLSRLCSRGFVNFLKENYPNGEVPFSIYIGHLVERLDRLMTAKNVAFVFSDIEIYERDWRSEGDHLRRDGSTGGENDNFPDQQRASGDGRGL
ncbi:DUF3514 domain-containing protein [Ehrlichia ruminantium]|nr:DUF3514 domain-containing protein [Ehrlichia ruminantium]